MVSDFFHGSWQCFGILVTSPFQPDILAEQQRTLYLRHGTVWPGKGKN